MGIDQFSLQGKRALITGSNRGIGLALARALGSAGASVILNGQILFVDGGMSSTV